MIVCYEDSILAYVASIRNHFGLASSYRPEPRFSKLLNDQKPNKIFLLLIDAMGANLIERKLPEDAFLRKHLTYKVSTVFPSTTTAATTSIRNGKAPNENAWLGWCQYLEEIDDIIIPFLCKGYYNDIFYPEDPMMKHVPVSSTEEELTAMGIKARNLYPAFREDGCGDLDEMCRRLIRYSQNDEYEYIYAYWDKYDTYMHEYGPDSLICDSYLAHINYEIEHLAAGLKEDTLLAVVADHGQIEIHRNIDLQGSRLDPYLARKPSIEPRAMAFFVKEGKQEEFAREFKEMFEKDYFLLSTRQVKDVCLFGDHPDHPRFEEFIGDFLAVARSDLALYYGQEHREKPKGQHAGMCEDEMLVPVILYQTGY